MRVLVTGGAGFIGSHLVRALLERGDRVRVVDDFSTGRESNLEGLPVDVVRGDVRDASAVALAVDGCEAVLHEAAEVSVPRSVEDPERARSINAGGTRVVLDACRAAGVVRFVQASSCAVYGASERERQSEADPPSPQSPYAASKLEAEVLALEATRRGLVAVSLRYFNVYGARQDPGSAYAAVVAAFASALREGRQPVVHGDGHQTRDFVHVDDVVRANLLALDAPVLAAERPVNVGTGRAISVLELGRVMGDVLGRPFAPPHLPERAGDLRRSLADTRRAHEVLGFDAGVTLEEGLERTVRALV